MKKYYLFGAGNNAWGVIDFFGKQNIIAIVDNEVKRERQKILGVPVISFSSYLKERGNETLIITAAVCEEIERQLLDNGITNYYVAPMIQMGMASVTQMIEEWQLGKKNKIVLFSYNPIAQMLQQQLKKCGYVGLLSVIPQRDIEIEWAHKDDLTITQLNNVEKGTTIITFSSVDAEMLRTKIKGVVSVLNVFELVMESNKKIASGLKKMKDVHKNEKCFIIGNGPSLKIEDLEKIHRSGIASFGMNLIYNIYDDTSWRPTYYIFAEYNLIRQYYDEIKNLRRDNLFIKNFYYMNDTPQIEGVNYYPGCGEKCYCEQQRFSDDISSVVYAGYSVMYDALQIAMYMGYKEIYLLGADFSYLGEITEKGNHVYDDKIEDKRIVAGKPHINITLASMDKAKEYADAHGIKIYNATRGGKLEVFQRVDFDVLL